MAPTFSSTASAGSCPVTSPAANQSGDGMPGDSFKGLEISVPYARWRGYGSEHGYHRGKLTAFSIDEDDAPEGYFTCVFPARERADAITLTWEQVLGDKKHGSGKPACYMASRMALTCQPLVSGCVIGKHSRQLRQKAAETQSWWRVSQAHHAQGSYP